MTIVARMLLVIKEEEKIHVKFTLTANLCIHTKLRLAAICLISWNLKHINEIENIIMTNCYHAPVSWNLDGYSNMTGVCEGE